MNLQQKNDRDWSSAMNNLSQEKKEWITGFLNEMTGKLKRTSGEIGVKFPYTTTNGKYEDFAAYDDIGWWTNGFWPGMMWLMYLHTNDERYKEIAQGCEKLLDEAFDKFVVHHDVGFMWILSALADYMITGNEKSKVRAMHAATILAGRFNINGNFIRAWDVSQQDDCRGWAIIDCLMNVPLLYWASRETDDVRFEAIAKAHTNTVLHNFLRKDFSVRHIVGFSPETGLPVEIPCGQGYSPDSAWSRGQAWAVYGFTLGFMNTGDAAFLAAAKNVADFVTEQLGESGVPPIDYKAPKMPDCKDTTAGAITACGLIELSRLTENGEKYLNTALKILEGLYENCDFSESEQSILQNGSVAYHCEQIHIPIIYGDYFLLEALMKLSGNVPNFWCAGKNDKEE